MKDERRYDLRYLTEQIYVLREFVLKDINPDAEEYKHFAKIYNTLCKERDLIESEVFGK